MKKERSGFAVMARLIGLVKPLTGYMVLAVLMGLAGHLCASFITIFGVFGLLWVLGLGGPLPLPALFAAAAVMALARGLLRYGEQACNHFIAFKLLALLRDKVFAALRRLAPAKLEGRDKGDLISVITSDIELLEVFYAHTISPAAIALLFSAGMAAFIGAAHPLLGAIALAAYLTVGVLVPLATSRAAGGAGMDFRRRAGELSAFVLDSLRGLSEILQYGAGARRLAEMERRTAELAEHEGRMKRTAAFNAAVTNTLILAFDLAMLFAAAALCMAGRLGFAGAAVATVALMSSFGPVVALANLGAGLQNTFAAGNRVLDILEETPVTAEVEGRPATGFFGAKVENVTFSYGGELILDGLSLDIPQHSVIGVAGRSGSGKSTLLKLLMRFWKVGQGNVEISGRSIDEVNTADLRAMEAYVTQETHLFRDSIRANLRLAKPGATDGEIEAACKKAAVHDFIQSLPRGYDTPVGELGETLSGGERQRLGLARAFLHGAPFLLLDEPTSNLDSLNEAVILRSLGQESAGRTVVLVSHRRSTLRIVDRVVSVERGRLS